jgi:hypothetical protein
MFTDIVGYTRLMGQDEDKALKILENNRALHKDLLILYQVIFPDLSVFPSMLQLT